MKQTRALAPVVAAIAFAVPTSAHAGSAIGDTFTDATLGSAVKAVQTLSGNADTSCIRITDTSKPFARWNDKADYVQAPGGSFEASAPNAWTTSGGVSFSSENEPWKVTGNNADSRSAVLTSSGSITSAPLCAGLEYPTLRFFARAKSGSSVALITARYTGPDGLLAALPLGLVSANSSWAPTNVSLTASGLPLATGTTLSIRIAPIYGTLLVDDVYVDPYRRY